MGILDKLLTGAPDETRPGSSLGKIMRREGVWAGPEFQRIQALPRCDYTPGQTTELVELLSTKLRRPGADPAARLRPVQALALADLHDLDRGLVVVASVGSGKTLILALAPSVIACNRPVVINYSNLLYKTRRDFADLRTTWLVRDDFEYVSCNHLSLEKHARLLHELAPDLILIDEFHAFKNPKARRSRVLFEYLSAHPTTKLVIVSGTPGDESLFDVAYLTEAALRDYSPYPRPHAKSGWGELQQWSEALDLETERRLELGALEAFGPTLEAARRGVAERVASTPGYVVERSGGGIAASLYLQALVFDGYGPATEGAFAAARDAWAAPNGREFREAVDLYRILQTLSLGFYHYLDPDPPQEWRERRREWGAFVRHDLAHNRSGRISEMNVARACIAGKLDSGGAWERWAAVKGQYRIKSQIEWFDPTPLERVAAWVRQTGGVVWAPYPAAGERVAELAGVPFFGGGGLSKTHGSIEDYPGGTGVVLSVGANAHGRNLQDRWHAALVLAPGPGGSVNEQMIGRLHRSGQKTTVEHTYFVGCLENLEAVYRAHGRQDFDRDLFSNSGAKLLVGDWLVPEIGSVTKKHSRRWRR